MTQHIQTPTRPAASGGFIEAEVAGRLWRLSRPADLESLWAAMGESDSASGWGADERLPYWVELWPAAVLLARFVAANPALVAGRACVDAGCGLGLSSLVAASCGARVLGFDYEPEALVFARANAALNLEPDEGAPLFAVMDWRTPALPRGGAQVLLGADILYERRFFEPVAALLDHALAPGGRAYIADPERSVSASVCARLEGKGWRVETPLTARVAQGGQDMTVHLREIRRAGA
ncbi:MAG: 50S ribosomal protein L11 methyltransferase [Desulfovibrio sp.]|jgi:predicted nicotinamide N-methyase|nr:50S ribosomal protein L11 methyltransferase [Desulfovibrio sp.]